MSFIVLLALLMPVAANAASFNKADCEFLSIATESCETGHSGALSSGSMAKRFNFDFSKRHPTIDAMCPQVINAFRTFCKTKETWTRDCALTECNVLPNGNFEYKCYHGTYVISKKTGKAIKDNCNKD